MNWIELSVEVHAEAVDAVANVFQEHGTGGVAIEQPVTSHIEGEEPPRFTGSAYCQARQRLPLEVLQELSDRVRDAVVEGTADDGAYRWRGLRAHVLVTG